MKPKGERRANFELVYIILILLLFALLLIFANKAGSEIQKIRQSYESFINDKCVCTGMDIVPNLPMRITEHGVVSIGNYT